MSIAIDSPPKPGEVVRVRSRRYLVEDVEPAPAPGDQTLCTSPCLEDDAEGEEVQVLWEKEVDAQRMTRPTGRGSPRESSTDRTCSPPTTARSAGTPPVDRSEAVSGSLSRRHPHRRVPARAAQEPDWHNLVSLLVALVELPLNEIQAMDERP